MADGDLQTTAGFDDGEDGRDAQSGFLAAEVDPVFADPNAAGQMAFSAASCSVQDRMIQEAS
jgi:hypothetical protein